MYKLIFVLTVSIIVACTCSNPLNTTLVMEIIQNDATSENLFFGSTGTYLYGFDKNTYEQKVKIKFNTSVAYGDKTKDGRVILGDQGARAGSWGTRLIVLDKAYHNIKEISCNPTPTGIQIIKGHIYVAAASMVGSNKYGVQIFNENTYELEKQIEVDDILERENYAYNDYGVFIAGSDYGMLDTNTTPYILKIDTTTHVAEVYQSYQPDYKRARIAIAIFDSVLVVTAPTALNGYHIACINLKNGSTISTIRLDTITQVTSGLVDPFLLPPCMYQGKLYYLARETNYPVEQCRLICLTYPTLAVESVKDLNYDYRTFAFDYYYLDSNILAIYSKDNGLNVISITDGTLLKHIDLE